MKINAFFPKESEKFVDILQKEVSKEEGEVYLVCAEYRRPGTDDDLADAGGLNVALTLDSELHPIIFCSVAPEHHFLKEFGNKFRALMAQRRTGFLQLPFLATDLEAKYKELLWDDKEVDTLAIEINSMETFENEMGIILHCSQSFFGDNSAYAKERIAQAVSEARKIGVTGTDEEVAMQIKNFKRKPKKSVFAGRYFEGIFCDVEGTLLIYGKVNEKMLKILQENEGKRPITLWTGGDLKKIQEILFENGITWKLVSKNNFTGAEVETAYDDETFSEFFEMYQIRAKEFIKV